MARCGKKCNIAWIIRSLAVHEIEGMRNFDYNQCHLALAIKRMAVHALDECGHGDDN